VPDLGGHLLPAVQYTVSVEETLASRLSARATELKIRPEQLIADCISLQLDPAARFLFMVERMEIVDQGLIDIASFVGEMTQGQEA
jgi:hypothetical protein